MTTHVVRLAEGQPFVIEADDVVVRDNIAYFHANAQQVGIVPLRDVTAITAVLPEEAT